MFAAALKLFDFGKTEDKKADEETAVKKSEEDRKKTPSKKKSRVRTGKARRSDLEAMYRKNASFADLLPWVEYLPESKQFLFEDGVSRMAVFNLEPIATEGRSQANLDNISQKVASVIANTFPEEDKDPWTVQFYLNKEPSLDKHMESVKACIKSNGMDNAYSKEYESLYNEHLKSVTSPSGYFYDKNATESSWRGQNIRIRVVIYRRYYKGRPRNNPEHEMDQVASRFHTSLNTAGIRNNRVDGAEFYRWMMIWFNPNPPIFNGDVREMLENCPYPGDDNVVVGNDLAEMCLLEKPVADRSKGIWYFNRQPHTVVQIGKIVKPPLHGLTSGELMDNKRVFSLTDKLPEGTIIGVTVFIIAQDKITNRINMIADRAISDTAESSITRSEAAGVLEKQARNDKLFPMEGAVFITAKTESELKVRTQVVKSILESLGLKTINNSDDPIALDNYIKNLPGVQIEALDRGARQRARLAFSTHISSMVPIYGRSRGSGNPCFFFWNRSGEPLCFDPVVVDRSMNAHMLVLGPTGAGKSSCLIHLLMSTIAIHNPKIYIIEAGNSFGLFGDHALDHGKTVNKIKLSMSSNVSIPPFADLMRYHEEQLALEDTDGAILDEIEGVSEDEEDDEKRDILGEAMIAAILMATGGEKKELDALTRSLKMKISDALKNAAKEVYERPSTECKTVLPDDVAHHLELLGNLGENQNQKREIDNLAASIRLFTDGLNGHLFNREGESWPDADITIIDIGQAGGKGYEDTLAVAYTSLIQHINAEVERNQFKDRMTIVLTDEAHMILKNTLLMPYVLSIVKMWRKLGAWYWLGTQNLEDFPDSGKRLLNMIEWWLCLNVPKDEIRQIARFKSLTEEEEIMMESTTKEKRKYTEGIVMSTSMKMLFRNVPPPLALSLAMTEKEEKVQRQQYMNEHGETEVQAAYRVAKDMQKDREWAFKT